MMTLREREREMCPGDNYFVNLKFQVFIDYIRLDIITVIINPFSIK